MTPRPLWPCLCLVTLFLAQAAHAGNIKRCSLVADGRAEVITFDAHRADGKEVEVKGMLARPEGTGPFPAIVMLPGGYRLYTPGCYANAVERFVNWGFVTLFVAPTSARDGNEKNVRRYKAADLARYDHAAAAVVAPLPHVDSTRIGVWGHSRGGPGAIIAVSSDEGKRDFRFRAGVAVASWPRCPSDARPAAPLLVMNGAKDELSTPESCVNFAARSEDINGFEFLLIPDAGHAYWKARTKDYDEAAAKLADERLKAFLARHLRTSTETTM